MVGLKDEGVQDEVVSAGKVIKHSALTGKRTKRVKESHVKQLNGETGREDKLSSETSPVIPSDNAVSETTEKVSHDFLLAEYDTLIELYTHTEDALSATFNFYLTLLSAVVGAILILPQLPAMGGTITFSTSGLLLIFAALLGIITQDGIINKSVDLAHYGLSINLLKTYLLSNTPEVKSYVFYLRDIHTQINPLETPSNIVDRLHKRLWWMIPLGTHQLFVGVINSLALTALAIIVVPGIFAFSVPLWRQLLGGPIGFYICFVTHCIYAQAKFRRGFHKLEVTMAGKAPEW
jgi:hypothetical protein